MFLCTRTTGNTLFTMEKTEGTHLIPIAQFQFCNAVKPLWAVCLPEKGRMRIKLQFSNSGAPQRVVLERGNTGSRSVVISEEMEGQ